MRQIIIKNLDGKKILLLFILTGIIYLTMLTVTIPKLLGFSGGLKIMDMMPTGYNPVYVNSLLNALGPDGRHFYLFYQLPLDMFFPGINAITFCLIFGYFLQKLGKINGIFFYICYLPLFAGHFDYCENIGIITMLNSYPDNPVILSIVTNLFSILKSSITTIYSFILIFVLIVFSLKKFRQKNWLIW